MRIEKILPETGSGGQNGGHSRGIPPALARVGPIDLIGRTALPTGSPNPSETSYILSQFLW